MVQCIAWVWLEFWVDLSAAVLERAAFWFRRGTIDIRYVASFMKHHNVICLPDFMTRRLLHMCWSTHQAFGKISSSLYGGYSSCENTWSENYLQSYSTATHPSTITVVVSSCRYLMSWCPWCTTWWKGCEDFNIHSSSMRNKPVHAHVGWKSSDPVHQVFLPFSSSSELSSQF